MNLIDLSLLSTWTGIFDDCDEISPNSFLSKKLLTYCAGGMSFTGVDGVLGGVIWLMLLACCAPEYSCNGFPGLGGSPIGVPGLPSPPALILCCTACAAAIVGEITCDMGRLCCVKLATDCDDGIPA